MATISRPHHMGIQVADLERSLALLSGHPRASRSCSSGTPRPSTSGPSRAIPGADIHAAILRMPGDTGVFLEILEYRNVDKAPVDTRTANPGTAHLAFFTRRLRRAVRGADRQGRRLGDRHR